MTEVKTTPGGVGLRRVFDGDRVRYESGGGTLILPRAFGAVFRYEAVGHYDAAMIDQIWASFDAFAATRPGQLHAFADFSRVTGYESEARRRGAAGFRARIERWHAFHVLLPQGLAAKLLSMAFSTIALVSGVPMKCYTDPREFAAQLARHDRA